MRRLHLVLEIHLRDWLVWLVCAWSTHRLWTPLSTHLVHYKRTEVWLFCLVSPGISEFKVEIVFCWFGVLMSWQVICLLRLFDLFRLTLLTVFVLWRAVVILEIKKVGALVLGLTFLLGLLAVMKLAFPTSSRMPVASRGSETYHVQSLSIGLLVQCP